jgi:hypothetical protein
MVSRHASPPSPGLMPARPLVSISQGRSALGAGGQSVLILDAASRAALVSARACGMSGLRVRAAESSDFRNVPTFGSRWCELRAVLPGRDRPDRYIDGLLELLDQYPADVTLPIQDSSVEALRPRRADIERRTRLALMSEPGLALAVDKTQTLGLADKLGLPLPRGVTILDETDASAAAAELGLPLVVKPATSWASQSPRLGRLVCEVALTVEELRAAIRRVLDAGSAAVVQQWAGGRREAVSLFIADGRVWARFAQVAHRMHPALGGNSVLRESIPLPEDSTRFAEQLALEMGLDGYMEVEFRRDAENRPLLMEINPRLSASVEVAVRAGVNFPRLLFSWATGDQLQEVDGYRAGVRMRWLGGELRFLRQVLQEQGRPDVPSFAAAVAAQAADTLRPAAYDYFDLRDPLPAVSAVAGLVRSGRRHVRFWKSS